MFLRKVFAALTSFGALMALGAAGAQADVGAPHAWQMNLQQPASAVMEQIVGFHTFLLYIITAISLFVLVLLIYVIVKFNAKANPTPARTSHNTALEVLWTAIPILILVFIAIPSFKLLYFQGRIPDADMTLKVTGHQWYWSYTYPDQGGFTFDSIIACRTNEECAGQAGEGGQAPLRLLDVDNAVVVPVGATVRIQLTAEDVIHSWAIPALGVKMDAVPGRLTETWMKVEKEGTYYGMCSELCGVDHGFMPIKVEAVSREAFDQWVQAAQAKAAQGGAAASPRQLAQARAD